MKRNDLRKFLSSSTFAFGFIACAVYFFDVGVLRSTRLFYLFRFVGPFDDSACA